MCILVSYINWYTQRTQHYTLLLVDGVLYNLETFPRGVLRHQPTTTSTTTTSTHSVIRIIRPHSAYSYPQHTRPYVEILFQLLQVSSVYIIYQSKRRRKKVPSCPHVASDLARGEVEVRGLARFDPLTAWR